MPKTNVSVAVMAEGAKLPRTVRGTGDNTFKAMAVLDPDKLPAVIKANKLTDKVKDPSTFPNHGRYIMTVANILRNHNKTNPLVVGKITVPPGGAVSPELDEAYEAAIDRASSFATKKAQSRTDALNKKAADKQNAKDKAAAARAKVAAEKLKTTPKVAEKAAKVDPVEAGKKADKAAQPPKEAAKPARGVKATKAAAPAS